MNLILLSWAEMPLRAQDFRSAQEAVGLVPGQTAPLFEATNQHGNQFNLVEVLNQGPVVLIFYRGFWCPVCNKHLASFQDSLYLLQEAGVQLIAVSPEKPEYLDKMATKSGAEFQLLYDENYRIADAYDVTFKPDTKTLFVYNTVLGAKLKETHSDDSQRLPIPATFLINPDGKIAWRHFDPDYKKRASVSEILKAL
ncbi:MAG: AhpC/TSA family protein [Bacteroidetes bacterium]|nr:AhpC/TSA family protein [Bacteroidota bacterium]MBU1578319.1 AhpC/TSA family protein [Bacteroidota bacterium]